MKTKAKVGIFSFTSCAGCQFNILFLGGKLFELLEHIDILHFPMAKENNKKGPFDIAFIEGCVTTEEEIKKLKEIRGKSKYLIALGTCATYGGIPSIKNFLDLEDVKEEVYDIPEFVKSLKAVGLDEYVKVDYFLRGCPLDRNEFVRVVQDFVVGKIPREVEQPVCIECREKENKCLLQQGKSCIGPVTHGGCDAVCPSSSIACIGCRGPLPDSNVDKEVDLLKEHGLKEEDIVRAFRKFAGTSKIYSKYVGARCRR
ncbi:MAG: oxidoreductase [Candidatus Woesearchaeota archaeon]